MIKTYVKLGLGIAIVMNHCLTGDEKLHAVPVRRYFPKRSYGLVINKGRPLSAATRRFIHTISPEFES